MSHGRINSVYLYNSHEVCMLKCFKNEEKDDQQESDAYLLVFVTYYESVSMMMASPFLARVKTSK